MGRKTIILLIAACLGMSVSARAEIRGLWVVRNAITTPDKVREVVEFAAEHEITVLFVQVRGRGDAFYRSYFVPGPEEYPDVPGDYDPLADIIRLAHGKNIEVHAWFNMCLSTSQETVPLNPEHPLNAHPDWFMVSSDGISMADMSADELRTHNVAGRFLSPGLEPVKNYLARVITEVILSYNVDGIHLDYIRYPGRAFDFHPALRAEYEAMYGFDPVDVVNGEVNDPTLFYLGKWVDFKIGKVTGLVRAIRQRIEFIDPRIRLSAAVKPHADEAEFQYAQFWTSWVEDGLLDFAVTMSYYPDTETLREVMAHSLSKVDPAKVIVGVGIYRLTPDLSAGQIVLTRQLGTMGWCLFSYNTITEQPDHFTAVEKIIGDPETSYPGAFRPYMRSMYE